MKRRENGEKKNSLSRTDSTTYIEDDGQDLGESKKDIAVVMMDQGGVVGLSLIRRRQRRRLPSRQQENEKKQKKGSCLILEVEALITAPSF
jgi:hypothetical protein